MSRKYGPFGAYSPSLKPSLEDADVADTETLNQDEYELTSIRSQQPSPERRGDYDTYRTSRYATSSDDLEGESLIKEKEQPQVFRTYRRRWFGIAVLTLQSFAIGWGFAAPGVVAKTAIRWYGISFEQLNTLTIAGNLVFLAPAPFVIWILNRWGPKWGIIISCFFTVLGNWIIYAAARDRNFDVNFAGTVVHSLAAPFAICAPTRYSRQWFADNSRTLATAIPSLAYPLGAGFGAVTGPYMVKPLGSLNYDTQALIIALVFTAVALPAPFLPAAPPTPPSAVAAAKRLTAKQNALLLLRNKCFYLQFVVFTILGGTIDAASAVTVQAIVPYGYTQHQASIAVALMIFVGIAASLVISPILDRTKQHENALKIGTVIIAVVYTGLPWVPQTHSVAALYVLYAVIGASSVSIEPAILEYQASLTHPVSPEISSVICWCGCKAAASIFTVLVGNVLVLSKPGEGQPKGSLFNGLLLIAGLSWLTVICAMFTGVWIFKRPEESKVKGND